MSSCLPVPNKPPRFCGREATCLLNLPSCTWICNRQTNDKNNKSVTKKQKQKIHIAPLTMSPPAGKICREQQRREKFTRAIFHHRAGSRAIIPASVPCGHGTRSLTGQWSPLDD